MSTGRAEAVRWACVWLACTAAVRTWAAPFFERAECLKDPMAGITRKIVYLPEATSAAEPTLDGKLDEPVWKEAVRLEGWQDHRLLQDPMFPVEAWVVRGADALYIATRTQYPTPGGLPQVRQGPGSPRANIRHLFNPRPWEWKRIEFHVRSGGPEWLAGGAVTNTTYFRDYIVPKHEPAAPGRGVSRRDGDSVVTEAIIPYAMVDDAPPSKGTEWAFDLESGCSEMVRIPGGDQYQIIPHQCTWGGGFRLSHCQIEKWGRLYFGSGEERAAALHPPVVRAYTDRVRYADADTAGEAFVEVLPEADPVDALSLRLTLLDAEENSIEEHDAGTLTTGAVGVYFQPMGLPHGTYTLRASVAKGGKTIASAERPFERFKGDPPERIIQKEIEIRLFNDPRLGETVLPVSVGVPLPDGLTDVTDGFVLQKATDMTFQPEWAGVPAQFDIRERWHRGGAVKWMGVSFDAEYRQGWPGRYRLIWDTDETAPAPDAPLDIEESPEGITVTTGPARFHLSAAAFRGINAAWLDVDGDGQFSDGEKLIDAGPEHGLWYENNKGTRLHAAHEGTRLRIVEAGPFRAVVCAEGWYADGEKRECKHRTRFFFTRGRPSVRVRHTWINTADTRRTRARNVCMSLGVKGARECAFGTEDGSVLSPELPGSGAFQIQLRSDHFTVEDGDGEVLLPEGRRMGGWAYARTGRGGVSIAGRDLWKLFPKELEVSRDALTLHLWPAHGREVFTPEEQLTVPGVIQFLGGHHGREMQFSIPQDQFEFLGREWHKERLKAEEEGKPPGYGPFIFWKAIRGHRANGQGVATSVETEISLHGPGEDATAARRAATVLAVDPHGIADPAWTRFTDVLGPLHEKDIRSFGGLEALMEEVFDRAFFNQPDDLDDYGMFNWPDYHTYAFDAWRPSVRAVHRCWVNSHYQEPRLAFLMYLRSGEGKYWRFATQRCRHAIDVDAVNYGEDPPIARFHQAGSTYHCKGVLHWGGNGGVAAHHVNYDFMLLDYYLTGDPRGPEFVQMWADEISRVVYVAEQERETGSPLGEALEVYQHIRDPRLLKFIHWNKDAVVSAPFELSTASPDYNRMLWWRMHNYTADPRVRERMVEQWGDGNRKKRWGLGYGLFRTMVYGFTGDKRILYREGLSGRMVSRLYRPRYTIAHPVAYTLESLMYLMTPFEEIGASGDIMMPSLNREASKRFWQADRQTWIDEGKKVWGADP